MRKATSLLGAIAGFALLLLAATPAYADPNVPGNNGTIKIHERTSAGADREPAMANDPHVCRFHVHGFNFDDKSSGTWWIVAWPPTGDGATTVMGPTAWSADGTGDWLSGEVTLGNGHYKAYAKQKEEATPGGNKQKVFWVECGQPGGGGAAGGGSAAGNSGGGNQSAGTSGATAAGGSAATTASTTTAVNQAVAGAQSAPQQRGVASVQNLPSTSSVPAATPLAALGLALIATGGILLRFRPRTVR